MSNAVIQLIVLAAIAIFLVLRLKNVLGTRDGFEKPIVVDRPGPADRRGLEGLTRVLRGLRGELVTARGPGAVIFIYERMGVEAAHDDDREWAAALVEACRAAGVALRGTLLSTPGGVQWLR